MTIILAALDEQRQSASVSKYVVYDKIAAKIQDRCGEISRKDEMARRKYKSQFTIDLTNTATSLLLFMLHDSQTFRRYLSFNPEHESKSTASAYNELRAEIDRRFPVPGKLHG